MKQQLKQKQTTEQKIAKKTKQLITNLVAFKYVEKKFTQTSMKLVRELIDLHRIKNPDYSFISLLQEKELMDYSDVLEKYIPYDVSPMVTKLYHDGQLDNTDLMVLANSHKEFRQPELQRKIVSKILTKEIKSKDLIRASKNEIREMIGEETNEIEEAELILLRCIYNMETTAKEIKKWNGKFKDLLKDKKHKNKLIESFNHLKNQIQFGLKIKV